MDLKKKTRSCYMIYGTENILIEKFQEIILQQLQIKGTKNYKKIDINNKKLWNNFFYEIRKKDFFFQKKIIILQINLNNIEKKILKKIQENKKYFKKHTIIIIFNKLNYKKILNIKFKKNFTSDQILISCFPLKKKHYFDWIKNYSLDNKINYEAQKYLYKKFKTDLLYLNKNLDLLLLTFPNKKITIKKIKKTIFQKNKKNIFQWINYLLLGKKKKSILSLYSLYKKNISPLSLIRYLETQINILILLKKEKKNNKKNFLYKQKVWQFNHKNYIQASEKNSYKNFLKIIKYLIWVEISIKKIKKENIWIVLKKIAIMFN
ncbi:DNA polymerase III subunit delta [Buchnera aphidicola]|uniref:DNA polymerase III subunit delta n=1 Tax=Buchnera aphidicola TaxID=9 RepID=UPI0034648B2C